MEKQRTTDLFRFVTLRAPEKISSSRKELGFIQHPAPASSEFLQHEGDVDAKALIASAAETFDPIATVEQMKSLAPDLYEFALWLSLNKNSLTMTTLPTLPLPMDEMSDELFIWDSIFHSILLKNNLQVRQAGLQIVIAMNFVRNLPNYSASDPNDPAQVEKETADMRRLANAKVVIPAILTPDKKIGNTVTAPPRRTPSARIEAQLDAKIAAERVNLLKGIQKELRCFEKQYNNDYNNAHANATAEYEQVVEAALSDYLDRYPKTVMNSETEHLLPEDLVPPFNFDYKGPFSEDYMDGKLSENAIFYIQENCFSDESIAFVKTQLAEAIRDQRKTASKATRKQFKTMLINGVLTRPSTSSAHEYSVRLQQNNAGRYSLALLLNTGYNGGFFSSHVFRIITSNGTFTETSAILRSSENNTLFIELFAQSPVMMSPGSSFTLSGTATLNNGRALAFSLTGNVNNPTHSGWATLASTIESETELHGINKIGIADYRRVEQELCCYIPGEVSHIENVMAKEYKERSTRDFSSTETTIETSSEREMEDLTDTTTTTRHELSSEIATVLEKDRQSNYGFSTGASGEYAGISFSADASGDFSNGQSSSDSNTYAKTYAEDVTRRALERIVQKTSVKRTTRMLREFEENNKHGFDNREGDQHVTGIYRWIDKVYKNRIMNYGKRLVYEFMVPEPSRFYKDAIIVQAEEEDTTTGGNGATGSTSVAVKPTHPSEHGIKDATSITRENYASMGALYGADLTAPADEYANVHKSYAQEIGNTDNPKSFSYSDLMVPQGYLCTSLNIKVSYNYKAKVKPRAYIKLNTAGQSWERTELSGQSNGSANFSRTVNGVGETISTSVSTKKITNFNLSVEAVCRWKASEFEAWQQNAYAEIMRAYENQLQAFNEAQAATDAAQASVEKAEDGVIERNPLFNAEIVKTELKRLCIEMLTRPFGIEQGRDFYGEGPCNVPELRLSDTLDSYASQVKFFEQAFDWDIMAQKFYPYYWAKRCDWKALFQAQDGNDYIFQAFLQSGMGRVLVPVRQGFEEAVVYYMETGEIWNGGGLAVNTDDEMYLSIIDELTQPAGYVEGAEWETVVPSSLTIIQARSALLDDEGLPCCHTDEDVLEQLKIKADTNTLQLQTPTA